MSFTIKKLVNPSENELQAVSKAFADSFADDDFTAIVLGRDPSLVYDFCNAQVIAAKLAGEIYIAESTNKKIVGCAIWFGPGREMFDSEDQNEQALIPLVSKLDPDLQKWWSDIFIPQYDEVVLKALGPGVKKNSWHLQLIGTIPEERRKGVARTLISEVREKAAGVPLCLEAETEVNVEIYEKIGFRVRGDNMVFTGAHGSFPMWVMTEESD